MATSGLQRFLQPAIDTAVGYLQVLDGDTQVPDGDNPIMQLAGRQALGQLVAYCHRPFVYGIYCENHEDIEHSFKVRVTPLDASVTPTVTVKASQSADDVVLTLGDDYEIQKNRIVFLDSLTLDQFVLGTDTLGTAILHHIVQIEYTGGFRKASDDDALVSALGVQAAANYRRNTLIGLTTSTGGSATGSVTTQKAGDGSGMVDTARDIAAVLVYEGMAFDC